MATALVTGASGFIGKRITKELLDNGYQVRASVRSDVRREQIKELFPKAQIDFVNLDLTKDDGWEQALVGVDVLLHTASPFPSTQPKDPQVLIRPAVDGTLRALSAAQKAGVKRVILTSSCAAIYKDSSKPAMQPSNEENWTDPDADFVTAYEASKTLAEKAAWEFVSNHRDMQLTTVNPSLVLGAPLDEHYGTSLEVVEQVLDGMPLIPNLDMPVVHVDDVAFMHVAAIDNEATFGERLVANAGVLTMPEVLKTIAAAHPEVKIRSRIAPDWIIKLLARFVPMLKSITSNLDRSVDVDASKAAKIMGFEFIEARQALLDSAGYIQSQR